MKLRLVNTKKSFFRTLVQAEPVNRELAELGDKHGCVLGAGHILRLLEDPNTTTAGNV